MAARDAGVTRKKPRVTPKAPGVTPKGVTPSTVGKAALCDALGWTRPRLDRRLDSDQLFPVAKRGTRAGGWEFDLAAVAAYLGGEPAAAAASVKAAPTAPPASAPAAPAAVKYTYVPPAGVEPVVHTGEQSARQRRDAVQAEILEDKLRRDRGELVQVEVMRQVLNTMLAHLGKGLDRLPDDCRGGPRPVG
jgi:phage terminase Nu1 subunit (DNA packaging protein)